MRKEETLQCLSHFIANLMLSKRKLRRSDFKGQDRIHKSCNEHCRRRRPTSACSSWQLCPPEKSNKTEGKRGQIWGSRNEEKRLLSVLNHIKASADKSSVISWEFRKCNRICFESCAAEVCNLAGWQGQTSRSLFVSVRILLRSFAFA